MSDPTIDDIFELAWLGFEHQECEEDCTEAEYYKQAKSALYELMLEIIGEDEPIPEIDYPRISEHQIAWARLRNALKAEQRTKLTNLMGDM